MLRERRNPNGTIGAKMKYTEIRMDRIVEKE